MTSNEGEESMAEPSQDWATSISEGHPVLDQLIRSNQMRGQHLAQTYNVGIDVNRAMIQHLLQTIFPEREDRQTYELSFHKQLAAQYAELEARAKEMAAAAEAAAASAALITPPEGLILPNQ